MIIFTVDEMDNGYMVGFKEEFYKKMGCCSGSYNIIPSRLLGFSYPDYLRYMRDKFNATLKGKSGYSYPYYKNKEDCAAAVSYLNNVWKQVERFFFTQIK